MRDGATERERERGRGLVAHGKGGRQGGELRGGDVLIDSADVTIRAQSTYIGDELLATLR